MDTTLEFPSSSSTPWCGGLRESDVDSVIFPNSGELFCHCRSSLAEGEHTIAFVSSFPFHFAIQSIVSWSFPSNPLCLLCLPVLFELQPPSTAADRDSAACLVPAAGEHSYEIPSTSSFRSEPRPNP
jgi:hypothetical protein